MNFIHSPLNLTTLNIYKVQNPKLTNLTQLDTTLHDSKQVRLWSNYLNLVKFWHDLRQISHPNAR